MAAFNSKAHANEETDKSPCSLVAVDQAERDENDMMIPPTKQARAEAKQFTVAFMGGTMMDIRVRIDGCVRDLRLDVEKEFIVPPACFVKLLQNGQVLLDDVSIESLDSADLIFGVVSRETSWEVLLQAASSSAWYQDKIREAQANATNKNDVCIGPMPTILEVLEDMACEMPNLKSLRKGKDDSTLEFSGRDGHLLLPSIDAAALLKASGAEKFSQVTISVGINSDAYNQGLGVVLEASPLMDDRVDAHGLPYYVYNGYGVSADKKQNAVKFHPGMSGGQLRVEGRGGWGNSNIGFLPRAWNASGGKFHTLELTLGADGQNEMCIRGTEPDQIWRRPWSHQLTDGRYFPALHAWLDLGSATNPLHIKDISLRVKMLS